MIRPAEGSDLNVIADSWLKSYRHSDVAKMIRSTEYFAGHQHIVERLLTQNGARIRCEPAEPSVVLAWICFTPTDTLHYVYTKESCRGFGFASELMKDAGVYRAPNDPDPLFVSHMTRKVDRWKAKGKYLRYDPYRVNA